MNDNKDLGKEAFVSFFFLGKLPVAPGTFGSAGALILAYLINDYIAVSYTHLTLPTKA